MTIHTLVKQTDPILKQVLGKFDFTAPPTDPIQLANDLAETMISNGGLGIAANQVGLPYRVFAINATQIIVCFNPMIVDMSTETLYMEEGCLSFPKMFVKVKRARKIKVRYTEPNGNTVTRVFDGMTARVFQHELAHLDGRTMKNDAASYHWQFALKKAKQMKDGTHAAFDWAKNYMKDTTT